MQNSKMLLSVQFHRSTLDFLNSVYCFLVVGEKEDDVDHREDYFEPISPDRTSIHQESQYSDEGEVEEDQPEEGDDEEDVDVEEEEDEEEDDGHTVESIPDEEEEEEDEDEDEEDGEEEEEGEGK